MRNLRRQAPPAWPTQAEIEAACDKIQAGWTETERQKRSCFAHEPMELSPVSMAPLDSRLRPLPD
jgi:hypothetical protein